LARVSRSKKKSRPTSKKKSSKGSPRPPLFPALFFLTAVCATIAVFYLLSNDKRANIRPRRAPIASPVKAADLPQIKPLKRAYESAQQQNSSHISKPTEISYYRLEQNFSQSIRHKRKINRQLTNQEIAHEIIHLLSFSRKEDLAPLPRNTTLLEARFNNPVITIDLSQDLTRGAVNFGGGDEMLAISSLTNSFLLNFPDYDSLQILIEGRKRETLAGHIDISKPLHYQPSIDD